MSQSPSETFAAIDRHALAAPREAESSIQALARYLTGPAQNPPEAARAIYRWVTENIAYDTASRAPARARAACPTDGGAILARRSAVCGGIAGLFEELARAAGLEAATLTGFSKGQGYQVGASFHPPADHAWNAVRLGGRWGLLDATWGGGAFEGRAYRRRFDGHYFLTPPDAFIHDHFPEQRGWQLLKRPLTLRAFERLPLLKPPFFHAGLELRSHSGGRVVADRTARITFAAPPGVRAYAELRGGGRRLTATAVLVQREGDELVVRVAPPQPGSYTLRLFVKPHPAAQAYEWALDYRLQAARAAGERGAFPQVHGAFCESGALLEKPLWRLLPAGKKQRFRLRVPGAEETVVAGRNLWQPLPAQGDRYEGLVTIPPGRLTVAARFPGSTDYQVMLAYSGY